jgi:hypothetical protein
MVNGWKTLSGKLGISGGFIPTHTANWEIALAVREITYFPCRRTRLASRIAEFGHGFFPGEEAVTLYK